MSRFNIPSKDTRVTENYEGAKAWQLDPEMALYTRVCTTFLQDQFYTPDFNDELNRIRHLITKVDHVFVAQLGVYAREKMFLRSIPLVMAVELAKVHSGDNLLRRMTGRVIKRADELTEIISYYLSANGRMKDWRDYQIVKGEKKPLPSGQKKYAFAISKQLSKGVADAFKKFDGYQFKKYLAANKEIKLRDVLKLTHPIPDNDKQSELYKQIATDTLGQASTWETASSEVGQKVKKIAEEKQLSDVEKEKLKKDMQKNMWERKINVKGPGEIGYMALLKNLMNFLKYDVSIEHIQKVAERLADKNQVLNSKQLPFRFVTAYRMLKGTDVARSIYRYGRTASPFRGQAAIFEEQAWKINRKIKLTSDPRTSILLEALEEAIKHACLNIPAFSWDTKVLIGTDTSGSMQKAISEKKDDRGNVIAQSLLQSYDIGLALSMMLQYKCKVVSAGMFGDSYAVLPFPKDQILRNVDEMHQFEGMVGYSTNGYLVIDYAIKCAEERGLKFDKVFMFSDDQLWDSKGRRATYGFRNSEEDLNHISKSWLKYKKIHPTAKLYIFDLAGYGTSPIDLRDNDTYMIAGWSTAIFDVIRSIDEGKDALEKIRSIEI